MHGRQSPSPQSLYDVGVFFKRAERPRPIRLRVVYVLTSPVSPGDPLFVEFSYETSAQLATVPPAAIL